MMDKDQALYFMEGVAVGFAAPTLEFVQRLLNLVVHEHGITWTESETVRVEIAKYLMEELPTDGYKQ